MIPIGALLIALGISWIMDFNAWPDLVIAVGVAYISSAVFGRGRSSAWALPACCYPGFWLGIEPERREAPAEEPTELQR